MVTSTNAANTLFQRVVAASGLAPVIAAPALQRALKRAGVDWATMTPADLETALGSIETSLLVYFPPDRVSANMNALRDLARGSGRTR